MKKFNHMYDIAFSVVSEFSDPYEAVEKDPQLIRDRMLKRIAGLGDDELLEALGWCHTYEEEHDDE
jgi:hypothetical protein